MDDKDDGERERDSTRKPLRKHYPLTGGSKERAGGLLPNRYLNLEARLRATESAERVLAWVGPGPAVEARPNLRADLESLANQTEGRVTATLRIIADDDESTCEQFEFDKGSLSEGQAKVLFREVIDERRRAEERRQEMLKVLIASGLSFIGGLLAGAKLFD